METSITVFSHDQLGTVRTLIIDSAPWFVGKDVAEALGYVDTVKAIKQHVDEEDKQYFNTSELVKIAAECNQGETPELKFTSPRGYLFINESGLYSLILGSKLPAAKEFKRWVTAEVLPSIRQTGSYSIKPDADTFLAALAFAKNLMPNLVDVTGCSRNSAALQALIQAEARFHVDLNGVKALLPNGAPAAGLLTPTAIGQYFGKSARDINLDLHRFGFLAKDLGQWKLTDKGKKFGEVVPFINQLNGYSNVRIVWQPAIIDQLQAEYSRIIYM